MILPDWLWHPLATQVCKASYHTAIQIRDCKSYNFHSGISGEIGYVTILVGIVAWMLKHNCYEHKCFRIGRVKGDDEHHRCKRCDKTQHPDRYHNLKDDGIWRFLPGRRRWLHHQKRLS